MLAMKRLPSSAEQNQEERETQPFPFCCCQEMNKCLSMFGGEISHLSARFSQLILFSPYNAGNEISLLHLFIGISFSRRPAIRRLIQADSGWVGGGGIRAHGASHQSDGELVSLITDGWRCNRNMTTVCTQLWRCSLVNKQQVSSGNMLNI